MTLRYWLSGPRILNGLVRPDVSFLAKDVELFLTRWSKASETSLPSSRSATMAPPNKRAFAWFFRCYHRMRASFPLTSPVRGFPHAATEAIQ